MNNLWIQRVNYKTVMFEIVLPWNQQNERGEICSQKWSHDSIMIKQKLTSGNWVLVTDGLQDKTRYHLGSNDFEPLPGLPAIKDHHIMSMNIYEPKNTDRKGKGITDEKASSSTTLNFIHPHISHSCWFFGGQGRLAEWTKMFFSLVAMLFLTMPVIHGGRWPVQESRCFPHWCHQ